jgi:hypothetical protein
MGIESIHNGFCSIVATFGANNGVSVAFPGVSFTPPASGSWIEVAAFWADAEELIQASIERGFFRVMICARPNAGLPVALVQSFINWCPKGTTWAFARIDSAPRLGSAIVDPDRVIIPITVRWRALRSN